MFNFFSQMHYYYHYHYILLFKDEIKRNNFSAIPSLAYPCPNGYISQAVSDVAFLGTKKWRRN
jgi:hypothetical protein